MAAHPPKFGKAGIHNSRRAAFKLAVTSQTSGLYIAIKTYIETQARVLLQDAETKLNVPCDDLFVKIFRDFNHVCPQQEDGGFKALERGKKLRKDIEDAREILEGSAKEALAKAGIKVK